jgi:hypothetical protein
MVCPFEARLADGAGIAEEMRMQIDFSDPKTIAMLVVLALAVLGIVIAIVQHERKRSLRLRTRFGAEYERALLEYGSKRRAEAELEAREARVKTLKIQELEATQRERFVAEWNVVQSQFLDHPRGALTEADELVTSLLQARGYPVSGYEQIAADVSVTYPRMIDSYRWAHDVAARALRAEVTTEDLRKAMIHYRGLFDELVQPGAPIHARSIA